MFFRTLDFLVFFSGTFASLHIVSTTFNFLLDPKDLTCPTPTLQIGYHKNMNWISASWPLFPSLRLFKILFSCSIIYRDSGLVSPLSVPTECHERNNPVLVSGCVSGWAFLEIKGSAWIINTPNLTRQFNRIFKFSIKTEAMTICCCRSI